MTKLPNDQAQRDRFSNELETNFSVIAAAGSGKTRAITDRIGCIARDRRAVEWFPKLVVVTFTHRAADEMQRRARQTILQANVPLEVVAAFDRAYFGTIHSFCVRLLNDYGHYLGLPPQLDLITDDAELWHSFVQSYTSVGCHLPEESRRLLLRYVPVRQLMELGRRGNLALPEPKDLGPCPPVNFDPVLNFHPEKRSRERIEHDQAAVREWQKSYLAGADFLPLIENTSIANAFVAAWEETFGPFRHWLTNAALAIAAEVQRAYREFRVDHGVLTYDDQVALADSLFDFAPAADRIRERDFRVILDEAQDTDPQQFSVLLEMTRPPGARGRWLESGLGPPRPGHFCMVGDRQQSIFGDRADLSRYHTIHQLLSAADAGEALEFSVTFRLDQHQVDFINATFPLLLNEADNQVGFVELNPRPTVLPGQIIRVNIEAREDDREKSERARADREARQLVWWIEKTGLTKLRARCWREVAILCPRKAWFRSLRDAIRQAGLDVQIQSESDLNADNPAHAWLAALATIMARPRAGYEIVGVLREIFGLSDHDLAVFAQRFGDRFHIQFPTRRDGPVAAALNSLVKLRGSIESAPLYEAVTRIVEGTQLRERLLALPTTEFGDLNAELDRLLVAAATTETSQQTLADFARDLRANFDAQRDSEPPRRDALQLITGKKAKGSEWDCVIVPFLSREVRTPSPDYARIVRIPQTGELIVALGRDDMTRDVKDALKLADKQEMERLLYVTLTRARHTLVFAFDETLFQTAKGRSPSKSQASWLQTEAANASHFATCSSEGQDCPQTAEAQQREASERKLEQQIPQPPPASRAIAESALERAQMFVRKSTPSRATEQKYPFPGIYADSWKEIEPELRPLTLDNAATRYGKWWHDFAQRLSWRPDTEPGDELFRQLQKQSPDPGRSEREWNLLGKHLRNADSFLKKFSRGAGATIFHVEMPLMWPGENSRCVEGIVDLAAFNGSEKCWRILDWKTNKITAKEVDELRAVYRAQIAAYWMALRSITGMSVEAGIYSTATGQFIPYQTDELDREWERLRSLSASELSFR